MPPSYQNKTEKKKNHPANPHLNSPTMQFPSSQNMPPKKKPGYHIIHCWPSPKPFIKSSSPLALSILRLTRRLNRGDRPGNALARKHLTRPTLPVIADAHADGHCAHPPVAEARTLHHGIHVSSRPRLAGADGDRGMNDVRSSSKTPPLPLPASPSARQPRPRRGEPACAGWPASRPASRPRSTRAHP